VVSVVRATLILLAACTFGCVESQLEPRMQAAPPQPQIVDTFWLQQSIAAMHQPPPAPVRSISLGYIGDTPLTGGVMRDTPMPTPASYMQQAPCACEIRNGE